MYHDLGNTCITILSEKHEPQRNLQFACDVLRNAFNLPAYINARNDVCFDGFKISGSAFRITNKAAFHHFTLLCSTDLEMLTQSLQPLLLKLESKATASVRSKVLNLTQQFPTVNHGSLCAAFATEFAKEYPNAEGGVPAEIWNLEDLMKVEEVANERSAMKDWGFLYGRTPEFTHRLNLSSGTQTVEMAINVIEGIIARVDVEMEPIDFVIQNALSLALLGQPYHAETLAITLKAQEDLLDDNESQKAFEAIRTGLLSSVHS